MNEELRDWLFDLVFKFQSATAVEIEMVDHEYRLKEEFHPVVDVVMNLSAPEGEGTLSDWYHKELDTRLVGLDEEDENGDYIVR